MTVSRSGLCPSIPPCLYLSLPSSFHSPACPSLSFASLCLPLISFLSFLLLPLFHLLYPTLTHPHSHPLISTSPPSCTYICVHGRNSSTCTFFCICLLFPSSVYVPFLHSVLIPTSYHSFLLPSYSSSHSQMCQFGLTRKTMVIQRPLVGSISKCNEQL